MYVYLDDNSIVQEIIPDFNSAFATLPISERYPPQFVSHLLYVDDSAAVSEGMRWDGSEFVIVPEPEPPEYPDVDPATTEPTAQDDTDALMVDHELRITMLELGLTE